jgi:hypothetical protein
MNDAEKTRETREGWPLLTVETEMKRDSKSTKARKRSFTWSVRWACYAGTRDFCSALAALVGLAQNIFSSPYIISIPLSPSPSKLGRQPCWVACLSMCLWKEPWSSSICIILFLVRPTVYRSYKAHPLGGICYT